MDIVESGVLDMVEDEGEAVRGMDVTLGACITPRGENGGTTCMKEVG